MSDWSAGDGHPPPPPPPPPPPSPPERGPAGRWVALGVAVLVVIGGGTAAAIALTGQEPAASETGMSVVLEPAGDLGPSPFLAESAVTAVAAFPDSVRTVTEATEATMASDADTGTLIAVGNTRNLYGGPGPAGGALDPGPTVGSAPGPGRFGGSGDTAVCAAAALAEMLAGDEKKAEVWADVRGINATQIPDYLQTLTPVLLLSDTLVTNYGFVDGAAVGRQAVLQAGSAVLVDWTGLPVVRCACGNPLGAPEVFSLPSAELLGTAWDGFDPARTVVVRSGTSAGEFVLVDITTGGSYTRPAGLVAVETTPTQASAATTAPGSGAEPAPAPGPSPGPCPVTSSQGVADVAELRGSVDCATAQEIWRSWSEGSGTPLGPHGLDVGNGWSCVAAPAGADRPGVDCSNEQGGFIVRVDAHVTQESDPPARTGSEDCVDSQGVTFRGLFGADNPNALSCREMIDMWALYSQDYHRYDMPDSDWTCFYGDTEWDSEAGQAVTTPAGCWLNETTKFELGPRQGAGGSAGGGAGTGGSSAPSGDLGLSVPMSRPACDASAAVFLFASTTPGAYEAEIQDALNRFPGSSYLRTDQSCPSLVQASNGNPIYAVYRLAGNTEASACAAVRSAGGGVYARWLDNSSPETSRIDC